MTTHHFTTTVHWTDPNNDDDEISQQVTVTYTYCKGWDGGSHAESPPEPASVEIQSVVPDVPDGCMEVLMDECFEDYASYMADAAEWRADMRRDSY